MKSKFDIFISYRREGGLELADSIYQRLINAGYSAFLDLEQLNSGKFNTKLIEVIEQCSDFILVLPPNALDRCGDEDDWVRQEVECAIRNRKNIIPIMLRGFEWPPVENLPKSLRELPNYNGISASDHNVFVENIERLKKTFLLSKPGITWKRYKKTVWCLIAVAAVVIGTISAIHFNNYKKYELLCNEIAMTMMTEVVKLDNNVTAAEGILEEWRDYVKDCNKEDPIYLQKGLQNAVDHVRKNLQKLNVLEFTDNEIAILRDNQVEMEEINAFSGFAEILHNDISTYLDNIIMLSNTSINDFMAKSPEYGYEILVATLKAFYYGTLSIYKTLPITIYDKLHKTTPNMVILSNIPLSLTKEDYDALQQGAMAELERIVGKMGANLNDLKDEVVLMEQKKEKMEKDLEKMYMEKRFQDIDEKRTAVAKRKAEVAEVDKQLSDLYMDALKRFELQPTDDQGTMWGKILRIAKLARISKKSEEEALRQHEELIAAAKEKGISTDHLVKPMYSITAKDKYDYVDKWLLKYQEMNPAQDENISKYVEAARSYFKAVSVSKLDPETGIIIIATKDNAKHPVYEIGDIIIERRGTAIANVEQYFEIGKENNAGTEDVVKVLRQINGNLVTKNLTIPNDCNVLVGISNLNE